MNTFNELKFKLCFFSNLPQMIATSCDLNPTRSLLHCIGYAKITALYLSLGGTADSSRRQPNLAEAFKCKIAIRLSHSRICEPTNQLNWEPKAVALFAHAICIVSICTYVYISVHTYIHMYFRSLLLIFGTDKSPFSRKNLLKADAS